MSDTMNNGAAQRAGSTEIVADRGSGRAFALLCEAGDYESLAQHAADALCAKARVLIIRTGLISDSNWSMIAEDVAARLRAASVRQASLVGLGAAASIAQHLVLQDPKFIRTLTLVDAASRPHPTWATGIVDRIEEILPLGLPLRMRGAGFDGKPFLQRIRCPSLIVTTARASSYLKQQAKMINAAAPTSWLVELGAEDEGAELGAIMLEFEQVPAKCPQKNVAN